MENGDMAYSGRLILQEKNILQGKTFWIKKSHCTDAREQPTQWLMCE
jgi:hypothetical protein